VNFYNCINIFYSKHKEILLFNKNIITSAIITAIIDICVVTASYLSFRDNYFLISSLSLIADFVVYNSIFIILFFKDNKQKYINKAGSRNKDKIRQDSIKLISTLGLSELAYLFTKFIFTYFILTTLIINTMQISLITTVISWIAYLVTSNIMIKKTKFIK
jgi:hypothetical protein